VNHNGKMKSNRSSPRADGRSGGSGGDNEDGSYEAILVDTVAKVDGLERLFVIGVALDTKIDSEPAEGSSRREEDLNTRSRIYRAMTRAHFLVVLVNEFVRGGWLEYLNNLSLDPNFDRKRELELAEAQQDAAATTEHTQKLADLVSEGKALLSSERSWMVTCDFVDRIHQELQSIKTLGIGGIPEATSLADLLQAMEGGSEALNVFGALEKGRKAVEDMSLDMSGSAVAEAAEALASFCNAARHYPARYESEFPRFDDIGRKLDARKRMEESKTNVERALETSESGGGTEQTMYSRIIRAAIKSGREALDVALAAGVSSEAATAKELREQLASLEAKALKAVKAALSEPVPMFEASSSAEELGTVAVSLGAMIEGARLFASRVDGQALDERRQALGNAERFLRMRHKLDQAAKMLSGEEGGKRDCAWYQRTLKESSIAIDEATTAGAINEAAQLRKRLEAVEVRGGWGGLLSCFMLS